MGAEAESLWNGKDHLFFTLLFNERVTAAGRALHSGTLHTPTRPMSGHVRRRRRDGAPWERSHSWYKDELTPQPASSRPCASPPAMSWEFLSHPGST